MVALDIARVPGDEDVLVTGELAQEGGEAHGPLERDRVVLPHLKLAISLSRQSGGDSGTLSKVLKKYALKHYRRGKNNSQSCLRCWRGYRRRYDDPSDP